MRHVFADTVYWSSLLSPRDQMHTVSAMVSRSLGKNVRVVTSDLVLAEFLNSFAARGARSRILAAESVAALRSSMKAIVESLKPEFYDASVEFYRQHSDKEWSLTDCSSFLIMQRYGITDALTSDHHFEQAGFRALLR